MSRVRSFVIRILNIFRRSRLESDLSEQLESHREMLKADLIERGMSPSDADLAATRTLGNHLLIREFSQDERVHRFVDEIVRDVRHACRGLASNPGFATVAVLTLALAVGANTAIFSIFDTAIMRPLPYPDADRRSRHVSARHRIALELCPGMARGSNRSRARAPARVRIGIVPISGHAGLPVPFQGLPDSLELRRVDETAFARGQILDLTEGGYHSITECKLRVKEICFR